jgi:hypothetical protein
MDEPLEDFTTTGNKNIFTTETRRRGESSEGHKVCDSGRSESVQRCRNIVCERFMEFGFVIDYYAARLLGGK